MKWYGVVKGFDRFGGLPKKKVTLNLDTDDIKLAAAVLTHAGYFNKQDALETYEEYKEDPEQGLQFLSDIKDGIVSEEPGALAATGEEWYGGFGQTKEQAEKMFDIAAEGGESEWDESIDPIEKAIDRIIETE